MRRRRFLAAVGAAPLALAQPAKVPRIGFLNSAGSSNYAFNAQAFRDGLRESGFTEGTNIAIEYRWANGEYARLSQLADELARAKVDVIAATGDIASERAAMATKTIPIVFTVGSVPVSVAPGAGDAYPCGTSMGRGVHRGA